MVYTGRRIVAENAIPRRPVTKVRGPTPVEVIFVNYARFGRASGVHIFHLANELEELGIRCTAYLPSDIKSTRTFGIPRFRVRTFRAAKLRACFGVKAQRTLIHAWTPREGVRRLTETLSLRLGSKYVVHLEDNEEAIRSAHMNGTGPNARSADLLRNGNFREDLSHPIYSRAFLEGAAGITCIVKQLADFAPADIPRHVFLPGCEATVFALSEQRNERIRAQLGYRKEDFVLVYPGNVHVANAEDVSALYAAVARLNDRGHSVRLLRIGEDHVRLDTARDGLQAGWLTFSLVPDRAIPDYIEGADALVQPGRRNAFNDYRFPSKLPMFLASGRPVIVFNSNIGIALKDGENCLLLKDGDADEIAAKLELIINNKGLARRLGRSGRCLAREHFSWRRSAARLLEFYRYILEEEHPPHSLSRVG